MQIGEIAIRNGSTPAVSDIVAIQATWGILRKETGRMRVYMRLIVVRGRETINGLINAFAKLYATSCVMTPTWMLPI
jgi:hypothetical protein